MKTIQCDIAVVSAGPAGLAAAIAAAEKDVSVAVFEKMAVAGGTANMGMGPFGVESRIQKRLMDDLTKEKAFEIMMDYTHWAVDARLVHDYFWKSGDTIDWLEDMGVEFDRPTKYYPGGYATWHVVKPEGGGEPGPRAASAMTKVMFNRAKELGVQLYMETPVKSLRTEGGNVIGLMAEDASGETYEVTSKAVIVCTGGFGNNTEMIKELTGYTYGEDIISFRIPGITGDGIRMAWDVGAGHSTTTMERVTDSIVGSTNKYLSYRGFAQPRALIVNKLGERVMNEVEIRNGAVASNVIDRNPGKCLFEILDDRMIKYYRRNGLDFDSSVTRFNLLDAFAEEEEGMRQDFPNDFFAADSLEELARQMGIDPEALEATVEEYNELCEERHDDLFLKDQKYLQAFEGKRFYAVRIISSGYGSLGGIKVNHKLEVLTDEWKTMPGFYAAGTDVCDIYAGTYQYLLGGNTMGFAVNSGRIAGENAADYVDQL